MIVSRAILASVLLPVSWFSLAAAAGKACEKDGARVTLSGRVHHRSIQPDQADGLPGHHYEQLLLDAPICMQPGDFDAVSGVRAVAIMPEGTSKVSAKEGARVSLNGALTHKSSANDPPDVLDLDVSQ